MFLTLHEPAMGAASGTEIPVEVEPPALIWGVLADDRRYPADVRDTPAQELPATAEGVLEHWSADVSELVRQSDPFSAAYFSFRAALATDLTPWPVGPVTALGDAVHAMPPTGGQAAATAIRDADVLAAHLAEVRRGGVTLPRALHGFHDEMATYAPAAVAESLVPVRWIRALHGPTAALAARAAFPIAGAVVGGLRALRRVVAA
jgi:2-polyprenyl-6-methoxyphenol hydroxylase-like FAD-dependent oxidoreductase